MDLINELTYILKKNNKNDISNHFNKSGKIYKLYNLAVNEKVKTDSEAANKLYKGKPTDKKYLMLKRNLVKKLSDLVLIEDFFDANPDNYIKLQFNLESDLNIAEKLLLNNVYHNALKIVKKVLISAEKYNLTNINVAAYKKLRTIYSLMGFTEKTTIANQKIIFLLEIQKHEEFAIGAYEILKAKTKFTLAKKKSTALEAKQFIDNIIEFLKTDNSIFLKIYLYKLNLIYFSNIYDFENLFKNLQLLEKIVNENIYLKTDAFLLDLYYEFSLYYRTIGDFENAEKYINECLKISNYKAFNKFLIQELNFDINLKLKNYEKSAQIIIEIFSAIQFEFLLPEDKSAWEMRKTYLFILLKFNNLDIFLNQKFPDFKDYFNIQKFMELTKNVVKDKQGYNIMLHIVKILLMLQKNNIDFENEGNSLFVYYHRYITELQNEKTKLFFKTFAEITKSNFDKNISTTKIRKYYEKLKKIENSNYDYVELIAYNEIIEFLNKIILK